MDHCRTCFEKLKPGDDALPINTLVQNNFMPKVTIKDQLMSCIPELNLQSDNSSIICFNCNYMLGLSYKFRCLALEAQKRFLITLEVPRKKRIKPEAIEIEKTNEIVEIFDEEIVTKPTEVVRNESKPDKNLNSILEQIEIYSSSDEEVNIVDEEVNLVIDEEVNVVIDEEVNVIDEEVKSMKQILNGVNGISESILVEQSESSGTPPPLMVVSHSSELSPNFFQTKIKWGETSSKVKEERHNLIVNLKQEDIDIEINDILSPSCPSSPLLDIEKYSDSELELPRPSTHERTSPLLEILKEDSIETPTHVFNRKHRLYLIENTLAANLHLTQKPTDFLCDIPLVKLHVPNGYSMFYCRECTNLFKSKMALCIHRGKTHLKKKILFKQAPPKEPAKTFKCIKCERYFATNNSLTAHECCGSENTVYRCNLCCKVYTQNDFIEHMSKH